MAATAQIGITWSSSIPIAITWSSMADTWDIVVYRGQAATITVTRSVGTQNTTGWTTAFNVKKYFGDSAAIFTKTSPTQIANLDPVGGVFQIFVLASDHLLPNLLPGTYFWDYWRTDVTTEDPLSNGRYIVRKSVRVN